MEKNLCKIEFLKGILGRKDELFGAFSSVLTKQSKSEKWKEVHTVTKSLNIISDKKDWQYCRDTVWPNIRKRTLAKMDNAKRTGTGGTADAKLNNVDEIVLQILGKSSPVVQGIGVADSLVEANDEPLASQSISQEEVHKNSNKTKKRKWTSMSLQNTAKTMKEDDLKVAKLELQVEYFKLVNHKMALEIYQLEQNLGIPHSTFTKQFHKTTLEPYQSDHTFVVENNFIDNNDNTQTIIMNQVNDDISALIRQTLQ